MEIFGALPCSCSSTVRQNWGSELSKKGKRICLFCDKPWSEDLDEATLSKDASLLQQEEDATLSHQTKDISARKSSKTLTDNEQLILAANRTTHAVRAFVLFLFYQLSAITIAFAVYVLAGIVGNSNEQCSDLAREYGNCPPNEFLLFVAIVIWIVGVVYSSNIGWKEIRKSEIL